MTNNVDLRNNTMSAAMRSAIGLHLATTTVLDSATAWRAAADILVLCPLLLEPADMRGRLTEGETNEQSYLANRDAMLYGHSFMVNGVRVDPRRVVVGVSAAIRPEPLVAAEQGWKPIASAPRDGSNIIIRFGEDGVSQAKYIDCMPFPWQFIDTNDCMTWLINYAKDAPGGPSHWMPLPSKAAPAQDDAKELADKVASVLEGYADNYDMMSRIGKTGDVDCKSVAHDIRRNMVDGVRAAIADNAVAP